jgi:hypothetical protein
MYTEILDRCFLLQTGSLFLCRLKKIVLNDPVTIRLRDEEAGGGDSDEEEEAQGSITQRALGVGGLKEDKDLVLFSLLKLGCVLCFCFVFVIKYFSCRFS